MSANDKLRRLRAFVVKQLSGFQKKRMEADYRDAHANATWGAYGNVLMQIDDLLAEEEPVQIIVHPSRRETLEQEIARLFTHEATP